MTLKLLLLTVLCVLGFGNTAYAKWELAGKNDNFTDYVDRNTIRRAGNIAKMWTMSDYASTQTYSDGTRYLSVKAQFEFDCYQDKWRLLALVDYSGQMATGNVTNSGTFENAQWIAIVPDTIVETEWKIACGKR